jgi:hypothetical protein
MSQEALNALRKSVVQLPDAPMVSPRLLALPLATPLPLLLNFSLCPNKAPALTAAYLHTRRELVSSGAQWAALFAACEETISVYDEASCAKLMVTVQRSEVHGMGLFASVDIPANTPFIICAGQVKALPTVGASVDSEYFWPYDVPDDDAPLPCMQGYGLDQSVLGHANVSRYLNTAAWARDANTIAYWEGTILFYQTTKHVASGQELIGFYQLCDNQ